MGSVNCRLSLTSLLVCILSAPVSGQLPAWLGTIDISPLRHDARATLQIGGVWIDTCVPDVVEAKIEPGRIDLRLDLPALNVGCGDAPTVWSISQALGPLTPWTSYDIYGTVELVDPSDRTTRRHQAGPDLLIDAYPAQMLGDFDQSGQVDAVDADLLGAAQRNGGPLDPFDVTADGTVDRDDRLWWLEVSPIVAGDADQSGRFDSADLVKVFQAGEYQDQVPLNSTWVTGDWDGDAEFISRDFVFAFVHGCYENRCCHGWCGPRRAVPEPSSGLAAAVGFLLLMIVRRGGG